MIASPSLGFILLGSGGMLGWSILPKRKGAWIQFIRRTWYLWRGGYMMIAVLSVSLALYTYACSTKSTVQPNKTNTQHNEGNGNTNIIADSVEIDQSDSNAVAAINKKLDELLTLSDRELRRLEKEYNFGFVLVAFSRETDATRVLPYGKRITSDWKNTRVYRDNNGSLCVQMPFLSVNAGDRPPLRIDDGPNFAVPGIPGTKWHALAILKEIGLYVECLKTTPIGICAVVGFKKETP